MYPCEERKPNEKEAFILDSGIFDRDLNTSFEYILESKCNDFHPIHPTRRRHPKGIQQRRNRHTVNFDFHFIGFRYKKLYSEGTCKKNSPRLFRVVRSKGRIMLVFRSRHLYRLNWLDFCWILRFFGRTWLIGVDQNETFTFPGKTKTKTNAKFFRSILPDTLFSLWFAYKKKSCCDCDS